MPPQWRMHMLGRQPGIEIEQRCIGGLEYRCPFLPARIEQAVRGFDGQRATAGPGVAEDRVGSCANHASDWLRLTWGAKAPRNGDLSDSRVRERHLLHRTTCEGVTPART